MKVPFLMGGKIVLDVRDYNSLYWYIRFCNSDYKGKIENSTYFYLHPKEKLITPSIPIKSEQGKHKGKWYIAAYNIGYPNYDNQRTYLPNSFVEFLKLGEIKNEKA